MSLKRFGAYAVLMYFVLRPAEGKPLPQNQQPDTAATTRPRSSTDAIRKTVGFMRVTFVEGDQRKGIAGTCFFVFYPRSSEIRLRGNTHFWLGYQRPYTDGKY